MWSDIEFLAKVAKAVPYTFIIIGFLFAATGEFVKSKIDARVSILKEKKEIAFRKERPLVDFEFCVDTANDACIKIISRNEVPFKASWSAVTENNIVVSGIMLGEQSFFPKASKEWLYKFRIQKERIVNNFVEVRLKYKSKFYEEMEFQPSLSGEIIKKYKLINGKPIAI